MVKKYEYRIVGRPHLGELEQGVRFLQRQGFELQRPQHKEAEVTLEDALDLTAPPDLGGKATGHLLSVSMRREIQDES